MGLRLGMPFHNGGGIQTALPIDIPSAKANGTRFYSQQRSQFERLGLCYDGV